MELIIEYVVLQCTKANVRLIEDLLDVPDLSRTKGKTPIPRALDAFSTVRYGIGF